MEARASVLLATLLWLGASLACAPKSPGRTLYQWTDADGDVRYTSYRQRIPIDRRAQAQAVVAPVADTHRAYWATSSPEAPREPGIGEPAGVAVEELPGEAAMPGVESGPPEPPTRGSAAAPSQPAPEPPAQGAPEAAAPTRPPAAAELPLDERIRQLEAEVAADQETLKRLIADPESASGLRGSPALREISERLPRLQAELRALRAQRAREQTEPAEDDGA